MDTYGSTLKDMLEIIQETRDEREVALRNRDDAYRRADWYASEQRRAEKQRDEARRVARETLLWTGDFIANICGDEEWDAYREELEEKHPWLREGDLPETGE
jgi:hypothetical protein